MLKIILDKDTIFEYKEEENKIFLNNSPFSWDKSQVSANFYHIIKDSNSYTAEVVSFDKESKTFVFKINQQLVQCSVRDQFDELLDQMGIQQNSSGKLKELKAPMPGLIWQVLIQEGQSVEQGDALVILEAMKMENLIKAAGAGVVKSIRIQKGDSVEKNQLLIVFE